MQTSIVIFLLLIIVFISTSICSSLFLTYVTKRHIDRFDEAILIVGLVIIVVFLTVFTQIIKYVAELDNRLPIAFLYALFSGTFMLVSIITGYLSEKLFKKR